MMHLYTHLIKQHDIAYLKTSTRVHRIMHMLDTMQPIKILSACTLLNLNLYLVDPGTYILSHAPSKVKFPKSINFSYHYNLANLPMCDFFRNCPHQRDHVSDIQLLKRVLHSLDTF